MFDDDDPREDDLLDFAVRAQLVRLCTSMPGKIVSYDATKKPPRAVVQPGFKYMSRANGLQDLPQIHNVPVFVLGVSAGGVSHPIEPGDKCLCIMSQRRIENWLSGKGERVVDPFAGVSNPGNVPLHDINDAIALVGLQFEPGATDDTVVSNSKLTGKVKLGSASADNAIAKGNKCDANFDKIEVFSLQTETFLKLVAGALGITYPPNIPPGAPGVLNLETTASNKVDTE